LLTEQPIKRGVHRSTKELEAAIAASIDARNADPKPFRWTKAADDILAFIARFCRRTSPSRLNVDRNFRIGTIASRERQRKMAKKRAEKRSQPKPRQERKAAAPGLAPITAPPPRAPGAGGAAVLDRLWSVVLSRRGADPAASHSARLLARGTAKVAQKFGEEAVECLIEAVAGNRAALINESADVLYHLIVVWVDAGVRPDAVWAELERRQGISGIAEKASRARDVPLAFGADSTKIP
jgi:phosphoribosyl-ATP pyrophosphohydrolase